ncbi:hypothetical protein BN1708_020544, partial [Verticillium longisporum]
HAPHRRQGC